MWRSTKTYGHERGLSAAFRQWRAPSHCRLIHGYALAFSFTFETEELDDRHWVMDFGGLGDLKAWLESSFDHKLLVAADDPNLEHLRSMHELGLCNLVVMERGVGCERFAEHAGLWVDAWLKEHAPRVRCVTVECREHGSNSAIWVAP